MPLTASTYNTAGFDLTVGGNIIVGLGNDTALKTLNATNSTVNVAGNFEVKDIGSGTVQATFTSTNSTVTINGTGTQAVTTSGSAFNNLTVTNASDVVTFADAFTTTNFTAVTPSTQLTFTGGQTYTINDTLNLNGQASGTKVVLRSTAASQYFIDVTSGIQNVSYVDVQYSAALSNDIVASNVTNFGNNDDGDVEPTDRWIFGILVTGMAYSDEGSTALGDGIAINLVVKGVSVGTGATFNSDGSYSIGASLTAGDELFTYIDGNATDGMTVSVSDGNALSGFDIYGSHVITRHDNTGALTNTHMKTAMGAYADAGDLLYSVTTTVTDNLTVSGAGTELYIPASHSYTPGGDIVTPAMKSLGTFAGGSGALDINGALTLTAGSFTSTSGNLNVEGNLSIQPAVTFTHNFGTIYSDGSGDRILNTGTATLNDLQFSIAALSLATVTGNIDVNGDLTLNNVDAIQGGGSISVAGDVTSTAPTTLGSDTVIRLDGTGVVQTISVDSAGGTGAFPGFNIAQGVGGSVNLVDKILIDSAPGFTHTSGAVNAGSSELIFGIWDIPVSATGVTFNDVTLSMGNNNLTVTGTLNVSGTFTVNSTVTIMTGTVSVTGNVVTVDSPVGGDATVLFTGGNAQTWSAAGGTGELPFVTINKSGNTLFLQDNLMVYRNFTHTLGDVDAGTSTVIFDFWDKTVTTNGMSFNNVAIQVGGNSFTASGTLDINGNFTLTSAANVNGGTFNVAGNVLSLDATIAGNANITLDGDGSQTIDTTSGTVLSGGTISINKTLGAASLVSDLTLGNTGQDLTVSQGTLDLNGFSLSVNDTLTVESSGIFQLQGGESVTAGIRTLNTGSTVTYNGTAGPYTVKDWSYQNLTFNGSGGVFNLGAAESIAQNLMITAGTFDLSGNDLTVTGTFSNDDTLRLLGSETTVSLTNDTDSGTVVYNGTSVMGQTLKAGNNYYDLTFDGVGGKWDQAALIDVNGNLTITNGTLNSAGNNITLSGNWSNTDSYTSGANTVTFDGSATQSVTSSGSGFNNLTVTNASNVVTFSDALSVVNFTVVTPSTQLTFVASTTHTISGTLNLNGQATATRVVLRSATPATRYTLSVGSAQIVRFVDVQDSNVSGFDLTAYNSEGSGANNDNGEGSPNWIFDPALIVTNNNDSGDGSLRWALTSAVSSNTIRFDPSIFLTGTPLTISPTSVLPTLSQGSITVDASNSGVVLDGTSAGAVGGLTIASNSNTVKGLRIQNYSGAGISLNSGTANTIGGDNTLGTGPSKEGNVIVQTNGAISVRAAADGNTIIGNYLGTDPSSTPAIGNSTGIWLENGSANNTVGGSTAGHRNVISGNGDGVLMGTFFGTSYVDDNTVIGNYIGTNVAGTSALANGRGIYVSRTKGANNIGGAGAGESNLISGNAVFNIVGGIADFSILNNYIGTQAGGVGTITNPGDGIYLSASNTNVTIGDGNIIAPHTGDGIKIVSGSMTVDFAGTIDLNDDFNFNAATTTTLNLNNARINIAGNWMRGASPTVNQGTSTVNFDGTVQTIFGSTTFYNLDKTVTTIDTLTFENGTTQTIAANGSLTLKGAASQLLSLRSNASPTQWNLSIPATATKDIQYVDVQDGNVSASHASHKPINPANSVNMSNNTDWFGALLSVTKSSLTISDPFNLSVNPLAIPGAVVQYTIIVSNAAGAATAENVIITDGIVGQTSELDFVTQFSSNSLKGIVVAHPDYSGGAETEYTNASDGPEFGGVSADWNLSNANEVTVTGITLDAGESATLKYKVSVK